MSALLRDVNVDGYRLTLWDTYHTNNMGKYVLRYEFVNPEGGVLFSGRDFAASPMHAIDSDEVLRALLGFLTLQPGDTDAEYFEGYTPEQRDFAETSAEELSIWAVEPDEDFPAPEFVNWA